jgi:hypothetical protein
MKKALVIGIDYYAQCNSLRGCVNDANSVNAVLSRNEDKTVNFSINLKCAFDDKTAITRKELKDAIIELFRDDVDIALFYFSGHGYVENNIGYLITSDVKDGDDGVSMDELLTIVNKSKAKNKIVILDCCHAGIVGSTASTGNISFLNEGVTFLAASTENQYAQEKDGHGIFTTLLVDALKGSAANLVGDITPGSVYAHIDQALGPWEQRPVFKTNVKSFISLRKVKPPIDIIDLQKLTQLFPQKDYQFPLDPSFEPEMKGRQGNDPLPNPINTAKFAILQKYNRINLVIPAVGVPHMWYAAMQSKSCELTTLGKHYWNLVSSGQI